MRTWIVALILALGLPATTARAAGGPTAGQRLANQLLRTAALVIDVDPVTVQAIDTATILAREAVALDSDDVDAWRFLRELAILGEDDELYAEALRAVVRLDPRDDAALLAVLNLDLDRFNSVDEREARYERMLSPEIVAQTGPAVASRLSLDRALMRRRHGDLEGFGDALARAAALDPSNRGAAAIAAGFFRMHVDDAYAEAELLANVMLADPTDLLMQTALASLMLENGAYRAAARLYALVCENTVALDGMPPHELIADRVISEWGSGDVERALATMVEFQRVIDEQAQIRVRTDQPELGPMERSRSRGVLRPTLAAVRAAIGIERRDAEAAAYLERAIRAYDEWIAREEGAGSAPGGPVEPDAARAAALRLEFAWLILWLSDDVARVRPLIEQASAHEPLTDEALARFEGWIAIREGDPARAIVLLEPLASADSAAALGLATARLALDDRRGAAEAYLAVAREQPGSLMGIWAANRLAEILGKRVALSPLAGRLEALAASIPEVFFRYPSSPSVAVGLGIAPRSPAVAPYTPIIVDLSITNHSTTPLAIDREGPIRPQVMLFIETSLRGQGDEEGLPPIVVNIDRRLRLEPGETLVVPVPLSRHMLGERQASYALAGMFVQVTAIMNFRVNPAGAIVPGLLGARVRSQTIRIEGASARGEWVEPALETLRTDPAGADLVSLALLGRVPLHFHENLALLEEHRASLRMQTGPEVPALLEKAATDIAEARHRLEEVPRLLSAAFALEEPTAQAWLLSVFPSAANDSDILDPIRAVAQKSADRSVLLSYLLFQLASTDDPMLDAARRLGDPDLAFVADLYAGGLARKAERRGE